MAARRGKSQARRNHGNSSGLPGWAWMVLGIVLAVGAILLAPKLLKSDGDGLWRPQPNPDAQPAQAATGEDEPVVPDGDPVARTKPAAATAEADDPEFDFYTLLPGKEVPLSDAELAATERAEAQRLAQQQQAQQQAQPAPASADNATTLPKPVDTATTPATPKPTAPAISAGSASTASTAAGLGDGTRYLLQAGAFEASGQAEELKARIALLGLGARVESAAIKGKTVYRVRMGPYGTASDLAEAKRKLASGSLPGMAIKVE